MEGGTRQTGITPSWGLSVQNFRLTTNRLKIRSWKDADRPAYATINADPLVRKFLGNALTGAQSDAQIETFKAEERKHGFTFWALELSHSHQFIGFVGLQQTDYKTHFTPAVEIGWRLCPTHWGHGYASEGASAVLRYAFEILDLKEIVAVTVPANIKSQSAMKRLGITTSPTDDFDHPDEPLGHVLQKSVLYRIRHDQWCITPSPAPLSDHKTALATPPP